MNKRAIVSTLMQKLSGDVNRVAEAAEGARQASIASPGRNQTRYGTEKEEYGYLADGLNLRRMEIERGTIELDGTILPDRPSTVMEGALVRVYEGGERHNNYLVLPYGGGETIETEQGEVDIITPSSPLAQAMMGKKAGEFFSFEVRSRKREYQVEEIL